jgi:hypothetical protein
LVALPPHYYSTQCEIGLFVAETLTRMSVDEEKANEVRNLIISVIMTLQFVQGTAKDLLWPYGYEMFAVLLCEDQRSHQTKMQCRKN